MLMRLAYYIKELVREYSYTFASDSIQLGNTNLVINLIDTGDNRPICQSLKRIALIYNGRKMMAHGKN